MGITFVEGPSFQTTGWCPPPTASKGKRHSFLSTFAPFYTADMCKRERWEVELLNLILTQSFRVCRLKLFRHVHTKYHHEYTTTVLWLCWSTRVKRSLVKILVTHVSVYVNDWLRGFVRQSVVPWRCWNHLYTVREVIFYVTIIYPEKQIRMHSYLQELP